MPRAWRLIKQNHVASAFDGAGARLYGSRWSSQGLRVAFAAETLSLAVLEMLVHLQNSYPMAGYAVFTVDFPQELVEILNPNSLPQHWRRFPTPPEVQAIGDQWLRISSSVLLRVPSAIIPHEHNFLINPTHADFSKLEIAGPVPFDIDPRIFDRSRP
jgi:RES domain-containing protein